MGERDLNGFHKSILMIHSPRLTSIRQLDRTSFDIQTLAHVPSRYFNVGSSALATPIWGRAYKWSAALQQGLTLFSSYARKSLEAFRTDDWLAVSFALLFIDTQHALPGVMHIHPLGNI
jgi:hypothetical protein